MRYEFRLWYAISFALQLGFLIVVPLVGFLFLGKWLDDIFHTAPLLLIAGIVAGITTSIFDVYHQLEILTKNHDKY
ncbi:AtpZ/AtpI family protein [Patescibacteria group bacterium]|nr:AtpZ/AtpI family protein [Patescibacteria group bacterium]MCL5797850.1 AtpZ/AtpI family protein [Patescibacteria group bacterium]